LELQVGSEILAKTIKGSSMELQVES
jgi:hypothetical protein